MKKRINYRQKINKVLTQCKDWTLLIVTYHYEDGTTKQQNLNYEFLFNRRGRKKKPSELMNDLDSIKWDFGAKYYTLQL